MGWEFEVKETKNHTGDCPFYGNAYCRDPGIGEFKNAQLLPGPVGNHTPEGKSDN
jgi:hypothetical protein